MKHSAKLPEEVVRCGGILKELKGDEKGKAKPKKFLETLYCTRV